ncbi:MAG: DUF2961 domain-containing protein, partial [Candidatus Aminicenantes bacterium]|nr:DUF2961 domain-containing protein [Candidatus Aminicenantes bacterium]
MRPRPVIVGACVLFAAAAWGQDLLESLGRTQDFVSKRISSYDRTGANKDALTIEPGATAVLAEIRGPGAVHHIWVTIAAEAFYGRKIVLRAYWDGEASPSIEAPIGDFFGVGHGLNRNLSSLPIACSSEGRARNGYWFMPFRTSARITVTNEGAATIPAFYYYIDYRLLPSLPADTPTFHAQYRQETPCASGRNYLILEAAGRGHYVGCSLSVLQRAMGWWGEGDDRIFVDGESAPSLHGTGSEDYFSDAWGMREGQNLFYGCPLQEEDFQAGAKATVHRFHIPDPVPFTKSIRVEIEHGHANDRADNYSSVAFWYQAEPHKPFPPMAPVSDRLSFAFEPPEDFVAPAWTEVERDAEPERTVFADETRRIRFEAARLTRTLSSLYAPDGARVPFLATEGGAPGAKARFTFPLRVAERYDLDLYFLTGPSMGRVRAAGLDSAGTATALPDVVLDGYAPDKNLARLSLKDVSFRKGTNAIDLEVVGKADASAGMDMAFVGYGLTPTARRFITGWNLIGPFDAPDMDSLLTAYPPEKESDPAAHYEGKGGADVAWRPIQASPTGFVDLTKLVTPNEYAVVYGLAYVRSPDDREAALLLGSDDGVRVWINGTLVHSNPAYRGAYPDQDTVRVRLRKGWNKVLIKVLQGAGGWGYFLRFA